MSATTTVVLDTVDAMAAAQHMQRIALDKKTPPGTRDLLRRVGAQLFAASRVEMTDDTVLKLLERGAA